MTNPQRTQQNQPRTTIDAQRPSENQKDPSSRGSNTPTRGSIKEQAAVWYSLTDLRSRLESASRSATISELRSHSDNRKDANNG